MSNRSSWARLLTLTSFAVAVPFITGCGKGGSLNPASVAAQGVPSSSLGYTCTFTGITQFQVSADPTQDFSSANASSVSSIQNNTCVGVSDGVIPNSNQTGTISRSGDQISIGPNDGITIAGSQATIPAQDLQLCSSGVQETGTLSEVVLDGVSDQILIYVSWNLVINGCTQTPQVMGQSNEAPLVVDASPTPSPSASPSPSPSASGPQVSQMSSSILPLMNRYIFDSQNNLYSAPLNDPSGSGNGLLKTSPSGTTTTFFSGEAVMLIAKDPSDNIYVMTDSAGDFGLRFRNSPRMEPSLLFATRGVARLSARYKELLRAAAW
jgi:hypothetical protein